MVLGLVGGLALVLMLVGLALAGDLPPGGTFKDDNGNIHEGNIEAIAAAGITKGCNPPANNLYCPATAVSRGQMAAFLVRALGLPATGTDYFADDDESIFEDDINRLAESAITKGCNPPANTEYCPDSNVTREQMAAFLVRALDLVDDGGGNLFTDDDTSIFEADIDKLGTAGVTRGCNPPANSRFCPKDLVLRDRMASFLARALGLTPIQPPPPTTSTTTTATTTTATTTTATTTTTAPSLQDVNWICVEPRGFSISWSCYESTAPNTFGSPVSGGFYWICVEPRGFSISWSCYESTAPNTFGSPVSGGFYWICVEPSGFSISWSCYESTAPNTFGSPVSGGFYWICVEPSGFSISWSCYESTAPNTFGSPVSGGFYWICVEPSGFSISWSCYESTAPNTFGSPVSGGANWECTPPGPLTLRWACNGELDDDLQLWTTWLPPFFIGDG